MKKLELFVTVVTALFAISMTADAQTVVNNTDVGAWQIYGSNTIERIKDDTVAGGAAMKVTLPNDPVNPWDAAAGTNITATVHKGDHLHVAVPLKATSLSGSADVKLDMVVQNNTAPFGPIGLGKGLVLTSSWQTFELDTIADRDYAPNANALVVHLATGKQIVYLGSPTIIDLGQ